MKNFKMQILKTLVILFLVGGLFAFAPKQASAQEIAQAPSNVSVTPGTTGQVTLTWTQGGRIERFALVMGTSNNNYNMGVLEFPSTEARSFTIQHLTPGQQYFARIWAYAEENGPATPSQEVSFTAPGAVTTTIDP